MRTISAHWNSQKRPLAVLLFLLFTGFSGLLLYLGLVNNAPGIARGVSIFYAVSWLIAISLFGGIHGAPHWAFIPAIALASAGQNLMLLLCFRALLRWKDRASVLNGKPR
jgi:hypothetical protein